MFPWSWLPFLTGTWWMPWESRVESHVGSHCTAAPGYQAQVVGQGLQTSPTSASAHLLSAGSYHTFSIFSSSVISMIIFLGPPFFLAPLVAKTPCFPGLNSLWTKAQGMTSLLSGGCLISYLLIGGKWHCHLEQVLLKIYNQPIQVTASK